MWMLLVSVPVVSLLVVAPAAGAHATPLGFSPRPGSTVGGPIDGFEVAFDQRIIELRSMGLSTEEGVELPGEWSQPAPNLIRFIADEEPTKADNYIVSYEITAEDGDKTRSAFVFTFDPGADPPEPVPSDEIMAVPRPWGWIVGAVAAALAVLGAAIGWRRSRSGDPATV